MESPPPLSYYLSQQSKKRVFPGSSSSCMEAEVVEIAPPMSRSSKSKSKLQSQSLKQKEVYCPEIIDIDMDDDSDDVISREADTNGKGKETLSSVSIGPSNKTSHVPEDEVIFSEETHAEGSHNLVDADDFDSDMDMFYYDDLLNDDRYSMLQSHFDQLDIPPGVEVPIPWHLDEAQSKTKFDVASTSTHSASDTQLNLSVSSPANFLRMKFEQSNQKSAPGGSLIIKDQLEDSDHSQKLMPSSKESYEEYSEAKKKFLAYRRSKFKDALNSPNVPKVDSIKSSIKPLQLIRDSFIKRRSPNWNNMAELSLQKQFPTGAHPANKFLNAIGNSASYNVGPNAEFTVTALKTNFVLPTVDPNTYGNSAIGIPFPSGLLDPTLSVPAISEEEMPFGSWIPIIENPKVPSFTGSSSNSSGATQIEYGNPDEVLKKFDLFKRFDTVQDYSDHHYAQNGSSKKQPSKGWAKKIQDEWRILEKDLPETIFVRVYESRMDLLRAVIIGAEGTPYHDGLFFFDLFFPSSYPNVPPLVHYHSGGLRINPNLYNCGKVCLSLLNTWTGSHKEKWISGVSTTLQVLVSIQGLILNAKPFFNEPGYANMGGTPRGEQNSLKYNENTFILSLKTMVYTIRRPPKYFEDFVAGHFLKCANDILVACKAYIDGAQVGCLVKGGVQDVDEGDKSCSQSFRDGLASYMKTVVDAFTQVGVKDCENFLPLIQKTDQQLMSCPPVYSEYAYPDYNYH